MFGEGRTDIIQTEPAALAHTPNGGQLEISVVNLMWLAEQRTHIPPAQPLDECIRVRRDGRTYHLIVPQNWAMVEVEETAVATLRSAAYAEKLTGTTEKPTGDSLQAAAARKGGSMLGK